MKIENDLRSRTFADRPKKTSNVPRSKHKEPYELEAPKDKETYDIHEYAESVGPQGLQIVINKHAPTTRKAIWFLIMFGKMNNSRRLLCSKKSQQ